MTTTTPCYRHPREIWMAACSDCTAWHMAVALAHRDEVVSVMATARPGDRVTSAPAPTHVRPAVLHLAA
jgi:hypothetical protein